MQFWLGTGDRHGFSTSFTATPDLNYARWWNDEDWALLKLPNDKCIGLHPSIGWYEPSSKEINLSDRYASAGFSSLEARGTLTIGQGRAYPRPGHHLNNSYYFSGSMAEGSSGGPVFSVEEGVLRIVAINLSQLSAPQSQSVLRYSDRFANIIKPMNKVFLDPSVKALLEADKARFNKPNPAAERLRMDHLPQ